LHEPPSSLWLNRDRARLGYLLALARRYPEALAELRGALRALPSNPTPIRAGVLSLLSIVELDVGDVRAALLHGEEGLRDMRALAPAHTLQQGGPLLAVARARLASNDVAGAEPLLREALAVRSPPYSPDDPRVLEVKVALFAALRAQGRDGEAGTLRREIEPVLRAQHTPYASDLLGQLK
jgi:serine/threonine-protein kinase